MPFTVCNTLMTESDREMFHTPIAVWNLSATFSDKMWFWPISHGELKCNKRLTQVQAGRTMINLKHGNKYERNIYFTIFTNCISDVQCL